MRPRVALYGTILAVLLSAFLYLLSHRSPLGLDAVRQAPGGGQNYATSPDGRVSNPYRVHLINRTRDVQMVELSVDGFPGAELVTPNNPYALQPAEVATLTVLVMHDPKGVPARQKFKFRAKSGDLTVEREATFLQ